MTVMTKLMDGAPGLTTNLRGYADWRQQSDAKKRVIFELAPSQQITSWLAYATTGSCYMTTLANTFAGSYLPVSVVRGGNDIRPLVRVESLADCTGKPGTFFVQVYGGTANNWDDGHHWDASFLYDAGFGILYVNLWGGVGPGSTTVTAEYLLLVSSEGGRVPDLGPEKLLNNDFEASANGTTPDNWTTATSGSGATAAWDKTFAAKGGASFKAVSGGVGTGQTGQASQSITLRPGVTYSLMLYYSTGGTSTGPNPTFSAYFYVTDGAGNYVNVDGISTSNSTNWISLGGTSPGEWRVAYFEFLFWGNAAVTGTLAVSGRSPSTSLAGQAVWIDSVSLKPIFAHLYAEPRISSNSVPSASMSTRDVFFGGKTVSSSASTVVDRDLFYATIANTFDWIGQEVRCFQGGGFANGDVIPRQDYSREFTAYVDEIHSSVEGLVLKTKDVRDKLNIQVPPNVYDPNVFTTLGPSVAGTVRPLFFGTQIRIAPVPLSTDPTTGYRTYEIADTSQSPRGLNAVSNVYAYADAASAAADDSTKRVLLAILNGYTDPLSSGQLIIGTDVQVIVVVGGTNDAIDFSDGSTRAAIITPGPYCQGASATDWATTVANAMNAVSSGFTVTYNDTTHKYTITKASGTFSLLLGSGTNRQRTVLRSLGFTGSSDLTAALTYTSDTAVFTSADKQHFIRLDATGYQDDASGTYTGTAFALIQLGPDVARYLISVFLRRPDIIDPYTFAAARTTAPQNLGIYLNSAMKLRDVFDIIENSCGADIVVDGDGMVTFVVQDSTRPASILTINDTDFLTGTALEVAKLSRDIYATVQINYGTGPQNATTRTHVNAAVPVRFKMSPTQPFQTYLISDSDALARAIAMGGLAAAPHRVATCTIKGKLSGAKIGTKVLLTSTKCPMGGPLSSVLFRVISIDKDPANNRATATLVEV